MTLKDNISDGNLSNIMNALVQSEYERPALEIEGYTSCVLLGTLKKKNKNAISHLERHIAGKISSKFHPRIPTVKLKIPGKAGYRTSVTFKL